MTKNNGHSSQAVVSIREAAAEDAPAVRELFLQGMEEVISRLLADVFRSQRPVISAVGVAAFAVAIACGGGGSNSSSLGATVMFGLAAAVVAACTVICAMVMVQRRAVRRYIHEALLGDMAHATHAYSDEGYGPGSRLWVAELVDGQTLTPTHQVADAGPVHAEARSTPGGDAPVAVASPDSATGNVSSSSSSSSNDGDDDTTALGRASMDGETTDCVASGTGSLKTAAAAAVSAPAPKQPMSKVVGVVALQRVSDEVGMLKRMSVSKEARGAGVAGALARTLISHAGACGFRKVILRTSSVQQPALRLYGKLGWKTVEVMREGLITFHVMERSIAGG